MEKRTSGINSIPATTAREIGQLKAAQDNTTAQLASDIAGIVGVGDIDLIHFLTAPFSGLRMFQSVNGSGAYGTLALLPGEQNPISGNPYYLDGKVLALDRAGAGNIGFNIVRGGGASRFDGNSRGKTRIIQKRFAKSFNPNIARVSYEIHTREMPLDYALQPDERLDGDFFPGNIHLGISPPYGVVDTSVYNNDPYGPSAWSGTFNTVASNQATIPVINSVTPNSYRIGSGYFPELHLSGNNFIGAGYVGIGHFAGFHFATSDSDAAFLAPGIPTGAALSRYISDAQNMYFYLPDKGLSAGTYPVWIIGIDGQVGTLENGFTILPQVVTP